MDRLTQKEKVELAETFAALYKARESKIEKFYRVIFKDFFILKGKYSARNDSGTKKLPKLI